MAHRHLLLATVLILGAAPLVAARPVHRHRQALPQTATVTVHRGEGLDGSRYAGGDAPRFGDAGIGPIGYWEANYGREDDAAIFAARYGCARPIWDGASNRYIPACN